MVKTWTFQKAKLDFLFYGIFGGQVMAWITWFSQNCFWIFLSEVIQLDCGWNCNWRIPLHRFSSQEPVRDFCGYCSWASRGRWDLIKMELMSLLHFFRRNSWQVFKIVVAVAFDFDIYYGQVTLSRLIPPTINRSHSVWRSNSPLIFTIVVLRQKKVDLPDCLVSTGSWECWEDEPLQILIAKNSNHPSSGFAVAKFDWLQVEVEFVLLIPFI